MSDLYGRIEGLCRKNGINPTVLCREAGVSRASLTDLKMGRKQGLAAETLSKIARYFGVSVDFLLGERTDGDGGPEEKTSAEADVTFDDFTYALYGEAKELTEENKAMLLDMARLLKKRQQEEK